MKQKRRIYDITNVLEGVGLIEKKNKNIIQWRFAVISFLRSSKVLPAVSSCVLAGRLDAWSSQSVLSLSSWSCLGTRDENSACQPPEVMDQVKLLKAQISELEAREKELDSQRALLEESIHFLNHDPLTRTYLFFSLERIGSFGDAVRTMLATVECVCWSINICVYSFQIES